MATEVRLRDDAVLELLYGSGLRVSELCGMSMEDVDVKGRWATVWGKGSKQRRVPISQPSAAAVEDWLAHGRASWPGPVLRRTLFSSIPGALASVPGTCGAYWIGARRHPHTRMP